MKFKQTLTVAFLAAGMLALTGSAAAAAGPQNAQVETTAEANASGNASLQVVIDRLDALQQKVTQLQDRVSSLEAQVAAQGQADARADAAAGPGDRPDAAQARGDNGAQVNHSVEVENGTKTISHTVKKNGNILNQFVKSIFVGELDGDAEAEAEAEAESESEEQEAEENETEESEESPGGEDETEDDSEDGDENQSAEAEADAEAEAEVNLN